MIDTYRSTFGNGIMEKLIIGLYFFGGIMICRHRLSIGYLTAMLTYCGYILGPIDDIIGIRYKWAQVWPSLSR